MQEHIRQDLISQCKRVWIYSVEFKIQRKNIHYIQLSHLFALCTSTTVPPPSPAIYLVKCNINIFEDSRASALQKVPQFGIVCYILTKCVVRLPCSKLTTFLCGFIIKLMWLGSFGSVCIQFQALPLVYLLTFKFSFWICKTFTWLKRQNYIKNNY